MKWYLIFLGFIHIISTTNITLSACNASYSYPVIQKENCSLYSPTIDSFPVDFYFTINKTKSNFLQFY